MTTARPVWSARSFATALANASEPAGAVPLMPRRRRRAATARANASIWLDLSAQAIVGRAAGHRVIGFDDVEAVEILGALFRAAARANCRM